MIIKLLWALLVLSFITIGVQSLNISDLKFRKSEQLRTFTGALNNARQEEREKCSTTINFDHSPRGVNDELFKNGWLENRRKLLYPMPNRDHREG